MEIKEYKDAIIDMYVNKIMTTVEIAKVLGCSDSAVGRLLNANGVKVDGSRTRYKIPKEQWNQVLNEYEEGKTSCELADKYGVTDHTICKIVRAQGGQVRKGVRRSKVKNHSFFNNINTSEKAYFLGWMIADGSVVISKTRPDRSPIISIELKSTDRYIIERFAEALGADKDIVKDFEKRGHSHMRFASETMAKDLSRYGVVPNKTMCQYLPNIDKELVPHLLRGYFDGNGTITKSNDYWKCGFYGSERICNEINNLLSEELGIPKHKVSKSTCYHVWVNGKDQLQKLYGYMYKNTNGLFLTRKKDKFEIALE